MSSLGVVASAVGGVVLLALAIAFFPVAMNWLFQDVLHLDVNVEYHDRLGWLGNVWKSAPTLGVLAALVAFFLHLAH